MENAKDAFINKLNEHKEKYPKLETKDLIKKLRDKKVSFNVINELQAEKNLDDLNYYYKLTVYKRNFQKNQEGNYINLDFSYLCDIASVDMQLRYILAQFTMDIEHSLKTLLMKKITYNDELDGYDIIESFLQSTENTNNPISNEDLFKKSSHITNYQYRMSETHKHCPPVWVVLEVLSFGELTRLFLYYFKRFPENSYEVKSMAGLLAGAKRIRNMSVHNTPFLFDLDKNEINSVNNYLFQYVTEQNIPKRIYKKSKIHDIFCVIYLHKKLVNGTGSRKYRIEDIANLTDRSLTRFSYLSPRNMIIQFFKHLKIIIEDY